jgi:hypothetical protein
MTNVSDAKDEEIWVVPQQYETMPKKKRPESVSRVPNTSLVNVEADADVGRSTIDEEGV